MHQILRLCCGVALAFVIKIIIVGWFARVISYEIRSMYICYCKSVLASFDGKYNFAFIFKL